MNVAGQHLWFRAIVLIALVYVVAGLGFGALAGASASNEMRVIWRLAAWFVSAAAFALHVGYDYLRLHSSPRAIASHVSGAVALGAFTLAIAANVHLLGGGQANQRSLVSAIILWPLVTAVPAYLVARGLSSLLARKNVAD